ncbi:elongation factor G, partial [Micromonospora aurantiaca]|nr:elongation factor G [Micromonospora aurantiaca]
ERHTVVGVPADLAEDARRWRRTLVETVAEHDEQVMALYLDGVEPSEEQLHAAIRRLTVASAATPVLCGSAFKNKGVQPLLDAVVRYLPSPLDVQDASDEAPLSALAFKVMTD